VYGTTKICRLRLLDREKKCKSNQCQLLGLYFFVPLQLRCRILQNRTMDPDIVNTNNVSGKI